MGLEAVSRTGAGTSRNERMTMEQVTYLTLERYSLPELQKEARRYGVTPSGTKSAIIQRILAAIKERERYKAMMASTNPNEKGNQ